MHDVLPPWGKLWGSEVSTVLCVLNCDTIGAERSVMISEVS